MWSLVIGMANDEANKVREEARSAGKSQAKADEAAEKAWRGSIADTAVKHLKAEIKVAKVISGILDC